MTPPAGIFKIWLAAVIGSGFLGALMAWWLLPAVYWVAVLAGWGVALANSVAGRWINRRALGGTPGAFFGWGVGANAFRMLTLVGFFVYILNSYPEGRGSFFASVFTVFFLLMLVDIGGLLKSQGKAGSGVERSDPDKCGGSREFGAVPK